MEYTKKQDGDGHWYWIPNNLLEDFVSDEDFLSGKEYMKCPDKFDEFGDKYGHFQTGGDPDLMPDFFKEKTFTVHGNKEQIEAFQKAVEPLAKMITTDESGEDFPAISSSEKSIQSFDSLKKIVEQLEKCDYASVGGSLEFNTAFISLKRMSESGGTILNVTPKEGSTYSKDPQDILDMYFGRGIMISDEHKSNLVWKFTANGDIPAPEPNANYSQVACLVVKKYNGFPEILYHNEKDECWDDVDMDDFGCNFLDVEKWVLLSELEKFLDE